MEYVILSDAEFQCGKAHFRRVPMLYLQQCYQRWSRPEFVLLAGRQPRERKGKGLASVCSVSHSKLTHQTHPPTFQVEEITRGQREAGSATWEKLPSSAGKSERCCALYIILLFEAVSPTCSLSQSSGLLLYLTFHLGANQVLLLFLSFPNRFHLIPGWVSVEPIICNLV